MRRSRSSASAARDFSVLTVDFSSRRAESSFSIARRVSSFIRLLLAPASCVCICKENQELRCRHMNQFSCALKNLRLTCNCCNSLVSRPISPSASACSICRAGVSTVMQHLSCKTRSTRVHKDHGALCCALPRTCNRSTLSTRSRCSASSISATLPSVSLYLQQQRNGTASSAPEGNMQGGTALLLRPALPLCCVAACLLKLLLREPP